MNVENSEDALIAIAANADLIEAHLRELRATHLAGVEAQLETAKALLRIAEALERRPRPTLEGFRPAEALARQVARGQVPGTSDERCGVCGRSLDDLPAACPETGCPMGVGGIGGQTAPEPPPILP